MTSRIITFNLNGVETEVIAKSLVTLQTVLREQLGFTATKSGCNQGGCGSCTVLVNDQPMMSCLLPVADIDGQSITTLEGISDDDHSLHPLQEAFFEHYATQCGYCTPGMLLVSKALLDNNPHPTQEEIADAISGNVCRCTGYKNMIDAIEAVAEQS